MTTSPAAHPPVPAHLSIGRGLADRVVIVTGASSGIGWETCLLLDQVGAVVVGVGQDQQRLARLQAGLGTPQRHLMVAADLSSPDCADVIMSAALDHGGRVDAILLVGAALRRQPLAEVTVADWDYQLAANLRSSFLLSRAVADHLIAHGRPGSILMFTSGSWLSGPLFGSDAYAASKAGIVTLSRGLAKQWGKQGIRVNALSPGQIDTPMQHRDNDPAVVAALTSACPLGRIGQPAEIAAIAVFLTSDHSSFITGATINASGGTVLY